METVNKKWCKYMEDYDNLGNKTISERAYESK